MQAQARDKREEEKRNKARGSALAASSWVLRGVFRRRAFEAAFGAAEMDAKEIVIQELTSGRNSDELANALSSMTSLV